MTIVKNQDEFKAAITAMEPEIVVSQNISLTTPTNIGYAVTIKGEPNVSLFWTGRTAANPNMLIITAAGNLVMESLTLDTEGRDGTLVQINGGKFTMNSGVVMQNIVSTSAQSAVKIGNLTTPVGGVFIMNGGLITGITASSAVFSGGGSVFMNDDASICDNMASGINMTSTIQGGLRGSLTMTGHSRICNNESNQGASAGIIIDCDIIMGVNEGDAPLVSGNRSPIYPVGGWLLSDSVNLTMRYEAQISDNYSIQYGGGIVAQSGTKITMHDNAVIKDNRSDTFGAGVILAANSTLTLDGQTLVSGNTCTGKGGGIHLQSGSTLKMEGDAAVQGNMAGYGAGIYLNTTSAALINLDASSLGISENKASDHGGGIFISAKSTLELMGQTHIQNNTATQGKGIYKMGALTVAQTPQILDGLFFDDLNKRGSAISLLTTDAPLCASMQIPSDASEPVLVKLLFEENTAEPYGAIRSELQTVSDGQKPAYIDNVPIISDTLTGISHLQLELSGYVSPSNVPLVIADKDAGYSQLCETDRAAWRIPTDFGLGYAVILTSALDQVVIDFESFRITYHNLCGADNPNPDSYKVSDLPIILSDPGRRTGYVFAGWVNAQGKRITEIPVGTTGDLSLTATWKRLFLSFDANAPYVYNMPRSIHVEQDSKVIISRRVPMRRHYEFIGWNIPTSGSGKLYFPGDTICIEQSSIRLYAQWHGDACYFNRSRWER